jgi:hypothetical protein
MPIPSRCSFFFSTFSAKSTSPLFTVKASASNYIGDYRDAVVRGADIRFEGASSRDELAIRNESDRPLAFVFEDRNWARDALTGERVIAMPAFRRLCPEQLLRPGDNADIGWIAIMFTDLKGSTELYDALGDVTAYNLVRDHFDFLLERVKRNHGFVVKTVGDAVMAAFSPR